MPRSEVEARQILALRWRVGNRGTGLPAIRALNEPSSDRTPFRQLDFTNVFLVSFISASVLFSSVSVLSIVAPPCKLMSVSNKTQIAATNRQSAMVWEVRRGCRHALRDFSMLDASLGGSSNTWLRAITTVTIPLRLYLDI